MSVSGEVPTWRVAPEDAAERLDRHVASRLEVARSQVQRWIRDGLVTLDGDDRPKVSTPVEAGALVTCRPPEPAADPDLVAEEGPLSVLFEDEHLVVVDKPADLAVHPGAGRTTGTLVHRLIHHFPDIALVGGRGRPGIVHRLDLDTTGVLVAARTQAAMQRLQEAFAERRVSKTYLAIVHGVPPAEGLVDRPVGRHPHERKRMTVRPDGRPARTGFRVLASVLGVASLLELDLETGRTHQIRVHMKDLGHPLVGDPVYGEARWRGAPRALQKALRDFPRPALHAWRLALDHPVTAARLEVTAPIPADLEALWRGFGGKLPGID